MRSRLALAFIQIILFQHICFAQNNFKIIGPNTTCVGSCERYQPNRVDVVSEFITIYYQGIEDTIGCHEYIALQENNFTVCFNCPGIYTIYGLYVGNNATFYDSIDVYVDFPDSLNIQPIDPKPCDNIIDPQGCREVCAGSTKIYFVDPSISLVQWSVIGASSFVAKGNEVTVTWGSGPNGVVSAFGGFGQQCFTESEICFKIVDPDLPDFDISGFDFCVNQNIPITTDYLDGDQYLWDFGNGITSSEILPIIAYGAPGTYQVSLTVTSACGCVVTKTKEVNVKASYLPTIECVSTICENTEMTYRTTADCGGFYWNIIGDGKIIAGGSTLDNYITILWGNGPVGKIELEVSACNFDQCPMKAIFEIPIISDLATIKGNTLPCNQSKEIYSLQKYGATEYNWVVNGGTITFGQGASSIIVEWNKGIKGSIAVDYINCYLKCGGTEEIDVNISPKYSLISSASKLCPGEMVEFKALDGKNAPATMDNWVVKDNFGTTIYTASNLEAIEIQIPDLVSSLVVTSAAASFCNPDQTINLDVLPKSTFPKGIKGELSICKNTTYLYSFENNLANQTYFWTITDGTLISHQQGKDIIVTWTSDGPYELALRQLDLTGQFCISEALIVTLTKVENMVISSPTSSCLYDRTLISATPYEEIEYQWSISPQDAGTIVTSDNQNIEILWSKVGTHKIELNTCSGLITKNINIHSLPSPLVSHPLFLCENSQTIVKTTNSFNAYSWLNNDGILVSNSNEPMLIAGTYILHTTDNNGCIGQESFTIDQLPKPNIFISTPDNIAVFLKGPSPVYPIIYALDAEDGYSYKWLHNGSPITSISNTLNTNSIGSYQVEVTDQFGCSNVSNSIIVYDIDDVNLPGPGVPCASTNGIVEFDHISIDCNTIAFESMSSDYIIGSERWSFSDNGSTDFTDIKRPIHDFENAGYYKVLHNITVDDTSNPGATCLKFKQKLIEIPIKAQFDFNNGCEGEVIQFYDRSTFLPNKNIVSWTWNFGDPTSGVDNVSSQPDPQHIFSSDGEFTISLTITNGACSDVITKKIRLFSNLTTTFNLPDGYCEKQVTTIFPINADPSFLSINWNFDDVLSGDNNVQKNMTGYHQFDNSGSYNVLANITSIYGCTSKVNTTVNIVQNNLSGGITSSEGVIFCEGKKTILSAPPGGVEWFWSNLSSNDSTIDSISGIYRLEMKDIQGCSYMPNDLIIQVLPKPNTSIISSVYDAFETSITTDLPINFCFGKNLELSVPSQPNYDYIWSSGATNEQLTFNDEANNLLNSGSYAFSVQIKDRTTGCTNESNITNVIVNQFIGQVKIVADKPGTLCEGTDHQLLIDQPINDIDYTWNQQQHTTSISASFPGKYFVVAKDKNGCTKESNQIEILSGPDVSLIPSGCFERCGSDTICYPSLSEITSYNWQKNGSNLTSSEGGNQPYPIFNQSGSYTLALTGKNGCTNISAPLNLDIKKIIGRIKGLVYVDVNANQIIDGQDTLISSIKVDFSGLSKLTDKNGSFVFENIIEGRYYPRIDENSIPLGAKIIIDGLLAEIKTCDDSISLEYLIGFDCFSNSTAQTLQVCYGEKIKIDGVIIESDTVLKFLNTNSLGCIDTLRYEIKFTEKISYTVETIKACPGSNEGRVIVNIDQSNKYTYTLNGLQSQAKNNEFIALSPKEYQLIIKDLYGCQVTSWLKVSEQPKLEVQLEASKISCQTGLATIQTTYSNYDFEKLQFKWPSGKSDKDISVLAAGVYSVTISNTCETIVKNIFVSGPESKNTLKKYVVCSGRSLDLFGLTFQSDTLFYTTSINIDGCIDTTTHDLKFGPKYIYDLYVNGHCANQSNGEIVILNPPIGNITYRLNNNIIFPDKGKINNLHPGIYQLSIKSDIGCEQKHEIVISEKEKVKYNVLSEDLSCFKGFAAVSLQLINYDTNQVEILWSNGSKGQLTNTSESGWLSFTVSNGCDTISDKVNIISTDSEPAFRLPTVINPSLDGAPFVDLNKTDFKDAEIKTIVVTDRMGRRLLTTRNLLWANHYSLLDGIYFYTIEAEINICGNQKTIVKTGKLLIMNN